MSSFKADVIVIFAETRQTGGTETQHSTPPPTPHTSHHTRPEFVTHTVGDSLADKDTPRLPRTVAQHNTVKLPSHY